MNILLLTHSFNSLTQRLFVELQERGHGVSVEFDINDAVTIEAADLAKPDLIIAPFLKRKIPEAVWRNHPCWVVHPGPVGDAGPSALDWAIVNGEAEWGVTVLQATDEFDGGPVWATESVVMRDGTKGSLYRTEVTEAAVRAVLRAVEHYPNRPAIAHPGTVFRPALTQAQRAVDWARDDMQTILRAIRSADGFPGLLDEIDGRPVYLFDAHAAPGLSGAPGALVARCGPAVARACRDGAVWIGHCRAKDADPSLKLPAVQVLGQPDLPQQPGYHDIWYDERHGVGYLHFPFYNGAIGVEQATRLRDAYLAATRRPTKVIVLLGGPDFWCNGIHLNLIEAADSPAEESWRSINAMDDLAEAIITTGSHLTIAALQGNAGAGGVFLALAADHVFARDGVVLNPHYKGMGNLFGSEYWTYLLPKRCGTERAAQVTQGRLPMGTAEAKRLGLIDDHFGASHAEFLAEITAIAEGLAADAGIEERLAEKRFNRLADEQEKPLSAYRAEELEQMKLNFFGFDPSYHVARYNFVLKVPKSRTPLYLARHRSKVTTGAPAALP